MHIYLKIRIMAQDRESLMKGQLTNTWVMVREPTQNGVPPKE